MKTDPRQQADGLKNLLREKRANSRMADEGGIRHRLVGGKLVEIRTKSAATRTFRYNKETGEMEQIS